MGILLLILKIIGIILLTLIGIILLFSLCILFVPLRYRVSGVVKDKHYEGSARITYFFHAVSFQITYSKEGPGVLLKLFGFTLRPKKQNRVKSETKSTETASDTVKPEASKPAEQMPEEQKTEELKPVEQPEEQSPIEQRPEEQKPEELKPVEQPEEQSPIEQRPEEQKPEELKPVEQPEEQSPIEQRPEEQKPEELKPVEQPEEQKPEEKKTIERKMTGRSAGDKSAERSAGKSVKTESDREKTGIRERFENLIRQFFSLPDRVYNLMESVIYFAEDTTETFETKVSDISGKAESFKKKITKYVNDENRDVLKLAVKRLIILLKHYKPRRMKGYLVFGTGMPDLTAKIGGLLCVLLPAGASKFYLEPVWDRAAFETDLSLSGHVRVCHAAAAGVRLFVNRNFRKLIFGSRKKRK